MNMYVAYMDYMDVKTEPYVLTRILKKININIYWWSIFICNPESNITTVKYDLHWCSVKLPTVESSLFVLFSTIFLSPTRAHFAIPIRMIQNENINS